MSPGNPSTSIGNLRQWILHLRKKIEIDPALPRVIITHHRQGYSFAGKEKRRYLEAVLEIDPDNTRALLGLLSFVLEEADD